MLNDGREQEQAIGALEQLFQDQQSNMDQMGSPPIIDRSFSSPGPNWKFKTNVLHAVLLHCIKDYIENGRITLVKLEHQPLLQEYLLGLEGFNPPYPHPSTYQIQNVETSLSEFCDHFDCGGRISELYCYQQQRGLRHEYILAHVENSPSRGTFWVRLERRNIKGEVEISSSFNPRLEARDIATIASRHEDLTNQDLEKGQDCDRVMELMTFDGLYLCRLKDLLKLFSYEGKPYTLFLHNCWSFCLLVVDCILGYARPQLPSTILRRPNLDVKFRSKIKQYFLSSIPSQCELCAGTPAARPYYSPESTQATFNSVSDPRAERLQGAFTQHTSTNHPDRSYSVPLGDLPPNPNGSPPYIQNQHAGHPSYPQYQQPANWQTDRSSSLPAQMSDFSRTETPGQISPQIPGYVLGQTSVPIINPMGSGAPGLFFEEQMYSPPSGYMNGQFSDPMATTLRSQTFPPMSAQQPTYYPSYVSTGGQTFGSIDTQPPVPPPTQRHFTMPTPHPAPGPVDTLTQLGYR
ncbi:unnamed protein product [Rhizoctonia solani]|uniref:Uncharacterized protein n=1 Tax=Rhizoctonia solani TaxID=456999 RepID=A0A8H3BQR3_9AGAM|nr:unnamed protein product [Rhizoctonia solani]